VIVAKSGEIVKNVLSDGAIEIKLLLFNGNILQKNKNESEKIIFEKYVFPIPLENGFVYTPKPQNSEGSELERFLEMGVSGFKKINKSAKDYYKVQLEYHNRRNMPVLLIVLTLLGFSLGFRSNRGKSKKGILAFIYLISFYVLYFLAMSLGTSGNAGVPIYVLIYGPTMILFGVFCFHYRKMDWIS
jgi:lipopolysaccharide export LptBFGC system permease protein LptF